MKIDSNPGTNFQPENFENAPVGGTSKPVPTPQTDQLESFDPAPSLFGNKRAASEFNPDVLAGASLITGGRAEGFGLQLPAVQLAGPDGQNPAAPEDGNWFFDGLNWVGGHLTDASTIVTTPAGWLFDGLMETSEAMRDGAVWLGDHAWDSIKQFPDLFESAGGLLKQGAGEVWDLATDAWDGALWLGNEMSEGVGTAFEKTAEGVQTVVSAVGDAIGDALDW